MVGHNKALVLLGAFKVVAQISWSILLFHGYSDWKHGLSFGSSVYLVEILISNTTERTVGYGL